MAQVERWDIFELSLEGPQDGNLLPLAHAFAIRLLFLASRTSRCACVSWPEEEPTLAILKGGVIGSGGAGQGLTHDINGHKQDEARIVAACNRSQPKLVVQQTSITG